MNGHKGRVITAEGKKFLDGVAGEVVKAKPKKEVVPPKEAPKQDKVSTEKKALVEKISRKKNLKSKEESKKEVKQEQPKSESQEKAPEKRGTSSCSIKWTGLTRFARKSWKQCNKDKRLNKTSSSNCNNKLAQIEAMVKQVFTKEALERYGQHQGRRILTRQPRSYWSWDKQYTTGTSAKH